MAQQQPNTSGTGGVPGGGASSNWASGLMGVIGMDPGAPGAQAANASNQIANEAFGQAQSQRSYMENALNQSQGYFNPASNYLNSTYGQGGTNRMPGYGEMAFGSMGNQVLNPLQNQDYYNSTIGQLQGPGALENFASSSLNGTNPYYQMVGNLGRQSIDQEMAAGGNFNSGARMQALGKYQSGLDAQQYQQEAQLQGQAQQAQMARLGLGGQLANSATDARLSQYNDFMNQAMQAQQAMQGRTQQGFTDYLGLGQGQANLSANMYDNANKAYAAMIMAGLGSQANAVALNAQSAKDRQAAEGGMLKSIFDPGNFSSGGGGLFGGGGGSGGGSGGGGGGGGGLSGLTGGGGGGDSGNADALALMAFA